jgi:hypothetical protein
MKTHIYIYVYVCTYIFVITMTKVELNAYLREEKSNMLISLALPTPLARIYTFIEIISMVSCHRGSNCSKSTIKYVVRLV